MNRHPTLVAAFTSGDPYANAGSFSGQIDWGDGTTSVGTINDGGYGYYYVTGSHTYTQASTYDADGNPVPFAMRVDVTDNVNGTVGSGDGPATVTPVTVSITGSPAASELDSNGAGFYFARTGDVSAALTVHYKVDSSLPNAAASGTNYEALSGTVTIDAGESGVFVPLKTLDDKVAGWTKAVKLDVQDGGGQYIVDPYAKTATDEITDSDLFIKLGDNSGNQVIQGSSDGLQNLVEAKLDFPKDAKSGATVTLSESSASHADLWASANPKPGDKPLLAAGDGSITLPIDKMPRHVWVGAIGASAAVGDFGLMLADAELGAADTGASSSAPEHPTSNEATTKPASIVTPYLFPQNDPNGKGGDDWNGVKQDWLIGQFVDLQAGLAGPWELISNPTFSWGGADGALRDYQIGTDWAKIVPVSGDDGGNVSQDLGNAHTGTSLPRVAFFWPSGSGEKKVSANITAGGKTYMVSTTFNLLAPHATAMATIGIAGLEPFRNQQGDQTHFLGLFDADGPATTEGIMYNGIVTMPVSATITSQGQWGFSQQYSRRRRFTSGGVTKSLPHDGAYGLDNQLWTDGGQNAFSTGPNIKRGYDTPSTSLSWTDQNVSFNDRAKTFVMFSPPGTKSRWVALAVASWSFNVAAMNDLAKGWTVTSQGQHLDGEDIFGGYSGFAATTVPPEWTFVISNSDLLQ